MPRSVNHVASRARRKKILKLTRGYFGCRRNVWTVAKNTWEKGLTYAYRDRKDKRATSALCGFSVSTLLPVCTASATHSSWASSTKQVSKSTVRSSPTSLLTIPKLSRLSLIPLRTPKAKNAEHATKMTTGFRSDGHLFYSIPN